ncbi:MAG: type II toxin-antitoxin system HicB family antitoxin [Bacteroidota bacterium]|nr:type II toxin-antitoxin system HicB family antitoxin [Bacteroidota bacterium]
MKKILVIIEKGTDGIYSAYTPDTVSTILNGQGNTVADAIDDLKVSMEEVIESYQETDGQIPLELQGNIEFEYKYDVPSLFNFFDEINMTTFSRKIGINASLLRRYKNGFAFASEKQVMKIKNGLHELGRQFSSAQL